MLNQPLVSVITCFLNPGKWLTTAIESVLHQLYAHWELILVDDGSVSDDAAIAKDFAVRYPKQIFYIEHPGHMNKGLPLSRNAGIALARGSYIAFLDADDYWLPGKLAHQLSIFQINPTVSMIAEASVFWYSWNNPAEKDECIKIGVPEGIYMPAALLEALYPLGKGQPPCPTGVIIKKEVLQRAGAFEDVFSGVYQLYEDQGFLSKMYLSETIFISATANNQYRKRAGSMSEAANDPEIYSKVRMFYLNWLSNYLLANNKLTDNLSQLIKDARDQLLV